MSHDPFDLEPVDAERAAEAERARLREKVESDDLKWLMADRRGRRFVYGILQRSGVFRLSFHTNALTMAFNEGHRDEGLRLIANLGVHCPGQYHQMLKEGQDE